MVSYFFSSPLGDGITVALKFSSDVRILDRENYDDPEALLGSHPKFHDSCVNIPNPIKIQLESPDPDLEVTTDRNGLFLIDEKYRNLECILSGGMDVRSNWVKLDNNYVEMVLDVITPEWLEQR